MKGAPGNGRFRAVDVRIGLARVQHLNTYAVTGCAPRHLRMDDFINANLDVQRKLDRLPAREQIIIRLSAEGFTQKDIADLLGISRRTVTYAVSALRGKVA